MKTVNQWLSKAVAFSVLSGFIFWGAMLFLVEIPGSPKIFSLQDHLYAMILNGLDQ